MRAEVELLLSKAKLTYREREIIKLRFGLGDGYTYTLIEVGRIFKMTRERVRQIEAKALAKLGKAWTDDEIAALIGRVKQGGAL